MPLILALFWYINHNILLRRSDATNCAEQSNVLKMHKSNFPRPDFVSQQASTATSSLLSSLHIPSSCLPLLSLCPPLSLPLLLTQFLLCLTQFPPSATFFSLPMTFFDPSTTLFNLSATLSVHLRYNSSNSHFSYHICSVPKFILTPPHMMYVRRIILCTLIGGCHTLITTQIIFVQNARHNNPTESCRPGSGALLWWVVREKHNNFHWPT